MSLRAVAVSGALIIGLDQATKIAASRWLFNASLGSLTLRQDLNQGLAFSLPAFSPLGALAASLLLLLLVGVAAVALRRDKKLHYPLVWLGSAGVSNFLDRLVASGIRDIFHVGSASFNVADLVIIFSAILIIIRIFTPLRRKPRA
ncbi:MAG: signal peptidase II [Candidatus Andersenbacteria bacterium]